LQNILQFDSVLLKTRLIGFIADDFPQAGAQRPSLSSASLENRRAVSVFSDIRRAAAGSFGFAGSPPSVTSEGIGTLLRSPRKLLTERRSTCAFS
jgi:hypothetical protein